MSGDKMKQFILLLLVLFTFRCSSVEVVQDNFDNSRQYRIVKSSTNFNRIDGQIKLDKFILVRDQENALVTSPKLVCKFVGHAYEVFEGDNIELKINDKIYKITPTAARVGETEGLYDSTSTQIGRFTFGSGSVSRLRIIVIEANIDNEIQSALSNVKSLMLRIYTKNIDGIAKNTFEAREFTTAAIKKFIQYKPEK